MKRRNSAEKRNDIINIAMNCMKDSSFHEVSIRDICRSGNIAIGTFYNYFATKEELLHAILLKFDDFLIEHTLPLLTCEKETDNLYLFTDSFAIDSLNNTSLTGTIVSSSSVPLPSTKEEREKEWERPLYTIPFQIIQSGQEKGEFNTQFDAKDLTDKLIMILRGASIEWYRRNYSFDIREYNKELTAMFLLILKK